MHRSRSRHALISRFAQTLHTRRNWNEHSTRVLCTGGTAHHILHASFNHTPFPVSNASAKIWRIVCTRILHIYANSHICITHTHCTAWLASRRTHMWRHINLADVIVTRRAINFARTLTTNRVGWCATMALLPPPSRRRRRRSFDGCSSAARGGVAVPSYQPRHSDSAMCAARTRAQRGRWRTDSLCIQINGNCRARADPAGDNSRIFHGPCIIARQVSSRSHLKRDLNMYTHIK